MLLKGWMVNTGTRLEDLAARLGVSIPHLSNVSNGKTLPRLDLFYKIVCETKLDADRLLRDFIRLHRESLSGGDARPAELD